MEPLEEGLVRCEEMIWRDGEMSWVEGWGGSQCTASLMDEKIAQAQGYSAIVTFRLSSCLKRPDGRLES